MSPQNAERLRKDRERKRLERATLEARGLVRVEVTVPRSKVDQIRALAEMLNEAATQDFEGGAI